MQPPVVAAVVLAAGLCRRFGGAKLGAPYQGRPLIGHVLDEVALAIGDGTLAGAVVVCRPDDAGMKALVERAGLTAVTNPRPTGGMASSLRVGLDALATAPVPPHLTGALILLGDQPHIRRETMATVVRAAGHAMDLVRPIYEGEPGVPGHPVFIHRRLWDRARALRGDQGFRVLTAWGGIRAGTIPVPGTNPDVDTPEHLAALVESASRRSPRA
jgi:molybdenum cofactor cytidylyltransferase